MLYEDGERSVICDCILMTYPIKDDFINIHTIMVYFNDSSRDLRYEGVNTAPLFIDPHFIYT